MAVHAGTGPHTPLPLIATRDADLADDVRRVAAAAAAALDVDVHSDPHEVRGPWSRSPLVIIGADVAAEVAALGLVRRDRVIVAALDVSSPADGALWRDAVAVGAESVCLLPSGESVLADAFADCVEHDGSNGQVVAVLGGRGGAGATTFAVALAVRAAALGVSVMLVDADPLGGGVDLAVGCEDVLGSRWDDIPKSRGRVDAYALIESLPHAGQLTVLSCDRHGSAEIPPASMAAVLGAAVRRCDLVVVDLPRTLSSAAEVALTRAGKCYVVVPAEVRATAAAARVCASARRFVGDLDVIVRGPAPSGLSADVIAQALACPLGGFVRGEPGLARALECGEAPGSNRKSPLGRLAGQLIAELVPAEVAA